jgi:hypothetical protein
MKKEERAEFLREMEIAKEQRLQALLDEQNARRSLEIANLSAFMLQADEAKAGLVKTWQEAIARITAVMNQAMTDMMNMLADTSVNIVSRMFEMSKNAIEGSLNEITRNIFSDVFQGFYRSLNGMKEDPNLGGLGKVGSFIGSAVGGPAGAVVGGVGMGLVALPELINSVKGIWASLKAGWAIIYKLPDQIWRAFEKNSLGKFINELTSEFIPNLVQFLIEKLVPALIALIPLLVVGILSGLGKTVDDALRTNPGTVAGAAIGAGLGAWAGSAVPVVGTWLGGAIGGVAGGYIGSLFHQGGTVRSGRNPMKAAAMAALGAPMFAEGGMVGRVPAALRSMMSFGDDTPIIAKYGEAVLNQQAVSRLGPGGVDALNRGMSVGQPPTSIVINARDDATAALAHMVIGTVSYDMSRVGGRTNRVVKGINRRYMPQPA